MKANIWQILGVILIVAGVVFVARKKMGPGDTTTTPAASNHTIAPAAPTTTP